MISSFLSLLRGAFNGQMWPVVANIPWELEKKVYSALVG